MEANILTDVQNIKERLFEMGQADVDDNVVHELINSFGPYYDIEVVTKLIAGRLDYEDSGIVDNSGTGDSHSKQLCKNMEELDDPKITDSNNTNFTDFKKSKKADASSREKINTGNDSCLVDSVHCMGNKLGTVDSDIAEISDSNSESYSYYSSYYDNYPDEDVDEDTGHKGINGYSPVDNYLNEKTYPNLVDAYKDPNTPHSCPKDTEKYDSSSSSDNDSSNWTQDLDFQRFHRSGKQLPFTSSSPEHISCASSTSVRHVAQSVVRVDITQSVEVELLEENNNDPNNNLDSIQFQTENSVEFVDQIPNDRDNEVVIVSDGRDSPQPSCSKDFNPEPSRMQNVLNHEARQIRNLLTRFDYGLIYKSLNKYRDSNNRVELALRELLCPEKHESKFQKRKLVDDICTSQSKKCHTGKSDTGSHKKKSKSKSKSRKVKEQKVITVNSSDLPDRKTSSDDVSFTMKIQQTLQLPAVNKNLADVPAKVENIEENLPSTENNPNSGVNDKAENTVRTCADTTMNEITSAEIDDKSSAIKEGNNEATETSVGSNTEKDNEVSNTNATEEVPMDITVDDVNEMINLDNNQSFVPSSDANGSEMSIKRGLLKAPKFVHKIRDVQAETPIATTAHSILAPPKLVYTARNVGTRTCPWFVLDSQKKQKNPLVIIERIGNVEEAKLISVSDKVPDAQLPSTSNTVVLNVHEQRSHEKQLNDTRNSNDNEAITKTKLNNPFQSSSHIQTAEPKIELLPQNISNVPKQGPSISGYKVDKALFNRLFSPLEIREDRKTLTCNASVTLKKQESVHNAIDNGRLLKNYYSVLPMFPDVDPEYIKEQCRNLCVSSNGESLNENERLNELVEHLLNTGWKYPRHETLSTENDANEGHYDVNEWYLDLLAIFPNADPNYLRQKAEEFYQDANSRKTFVQSNIDNPNYPTRDEYMARKKITEQQKQYTVNFSVEKFLELCPDPFSRFERSNRQCTFQKDAFEFLKYRFNRIRMDTLRDVYQKNRHNLSLTANELELMDKNMKTKRTVPRYLATQDIPLLQEMAYITHKGQLQKYLDDLKLKEAKEFKRLKEQDNLLQCQCCFDNEVMPSKCVTCNEGHVFCRQCLQTGVDTKLGDGEAHIPCFSNCGSEFSLSVLQSALPPTKFSILLQKRQQAEVMAAGLEGLVSCPFCHFASIPPPESKVFECLNPDCMKESCRLCKELNHVPLKCHEANSDNLRHILEEKMTEALVRTCYKCRKPFFKDEGCNRMVCVCGAVMCYICDKPIKGYNHFSGQGSDRKDLCPLWSDNNRINAQTVAIAAEETVKQLKKENPSAKLDAASLVPQVPSSSKGPHELVPSSGVIPNRAFTVSKRK